MKLSGACWEAAVWGLSAGSRGVRTPGRPCRSAPVDHWGSACAVVAVVGDGRCRDRLFGVYGQMRVTTASERKDEEGQADGSLLLLSL